MNFHSDLTTLIFICLFLPGLDTVSSQNWQEIAKPTGPYSMVDYGSRISVSGGYFLIPDNSNYQLSLFKRDQGGTDNWGHFKTLVPSIREWEGSYFNSVDMDGGYAIIGDHKNRNWDGTTLNESGAAIIFFKDQGSSDNWGEVKAFRPSDRAAYDWFGYSVAISGDYAIVGAPQEDHNGGDYKSNAGSAYIYYKDQPTANNWGQLVKLVASDRASDDNFGWSVDISGDYAVVGARGQDTDENGNNSRSYAGAAYVFHKDTPSTNQWGQVAKIVPEDREASDFFGYTLALEDTILAVGAYGQDENSGNQDSLSMSGCVYIFYKDRGGIGNWGQVQMITASDRGANDNFGSSVTISGEKIVAGAFYDDEDPFGQDYQWNSGSAYIFSMDEGGTDNWGELQKLVASDRYVDGGGGAKGSTYEFGKMVSIDNNDIAIGGEDGSYIFNFVSQSTGLTVTDMQVNQATISWTNGDQSNRVAFMRIDGGELPYPEYNTTYIADAVYDETSGGGDGAKLPPSWQCVYNGSGNSVTVTGLSSAQKYRIMICEYYGAAGTEVYYGLPAPGNPLDFTTYIVLTGVGVDVDDEMLTNTDTTMQYSLNSTNGSDGDWSDCDHDYLAKGYYTSVIFDPGPVYVREKAKPENFRLVAIIPPVPAAPDFTIDYYNEETNEIVNDSIEYNTDNNFFSSNLIGNNVPVNINPGTDLYFRVKATNTSFAGEVQHLLVKDRPEEPVFTINYPAETTNENGDTLFSYLVVSTVAMVEDTFKSTMAPIPILPGAEHGFWQRAFDTSFASIMTGFMADERPDATTYSVDFVSEVTNEVIATSDEYSVTGDFTDATTGPATKMPLTPGTDVYFRNISTVSSFSGEIQQLVVPYRPDVPVVSLSDKNSATAKFKKSLDGSGDDVLIADGYEYSLDAGINWNQITVITTVDASGNKYIIVRRKANISAFASEPTDNIDYQQPVVIAAVQSACNGEDNQVIAQSNIDNGWVYLVLDGEDQSTRTELEAAIAILNGASAVVSNAGTDVEIITEGLSPGTYYSYAVNMLDSLSQKGSNPITIYGIPDVSLGEDIVKCEETHIILDPGVDFSSYSWSMIDSTDRTIRISEDGTYSLTVTDDNGCVSTDSIDVSFNIPFAYEKLCIVTVDLSSGKNLVVWEKTEDVGTVGYHIYRESTIGQYDLIGEIMNPSLSVFKDTAVSPENRAYLYKITSIDTCGNESFLDSTAYHKPIHLNYVSTDVGVNLEWTNYAIEGISDLGDYLTSFEIYRGSDSTALTILATVGSINNYTDNDATALNQKYYYRVAGVLKDPCYPSGGVDKKSGAGTYHHSLSNLDNNRYNTTSVGGSDAAGQMVIYPNPMTDRAMIRYSNPDHSEYRLTIRDISGRIVLAQENITEETVIIRRNDVGAGYFFVELKGERVFKGSMVVD
jgi:hypothetical protein